MFKGQAFDTFQLMIAAVIAVAILGILLGIIGNISGNVTQTPIATAKSLINTALESPCAPMSSDTVNFKANEGWVSSTFDESSGYRASNVETFCDSSVENLFTCNGAELSTASEDFQGKMTVICKGENCAITVYTATKTSPSIEYGSTGCD